MENVRGYKHRAIERFFNKVLVEGAGIPRRVEEEFRSTFISRKKWRKKYGNYKDINLMNLSTKIQKNIIDMSDKRIKNKGET